MKETHLGGKGDYCNIEKSLSYHISSHITKLYHVSSDIREDIFLWHIMGVNFKYYKGRKNGGRQGKKSEKQKQSPACIIQKSFFSLYLPQSCDGPKFILYDSSTMNYLLFSATHTALCYCIAFKCLPYVSPPSNSLFILALLTQGSLFSLPPGKIYPFLPLHSYASKVISPS